MIVAHDRKTLMNATQYMGPAQVARVNQENGQVLLLLDKPEKRRETWAQSALSSDYAVQAGDKVLAIGEEQDEFYIIGVLKKVNMVQSDDLPTRTRELVFEPDKETGKTRVTIESGDLEFVTRNGDIEFTSAGAIKLSCRHPLDMKSEMGIRMAVADALGSIRSWMEVHAQGTTLLSPNVDIKANRSNFQIKDTRFTGKTLTGKMSVTRWVTDSLETVAQTVTSQAKNIYASVKELYQLMTGRSRTLVESTSHFKAKNAFLKADEDLKMDAEKIHLG